MRRFSPWRLLGLLALGVCILSGASVFGEPPPGKPFFQTIGTAEITSIAWSPDGESLLTGDKEGRAVIWRLSTGRIVRDFHFADAPLARVAFLPDGQSLVLVNTLGETRIADSRTGDLQQTFLPASQAPEGMEHPDALQVFRDLAVSDDGVFLVTQSQISREPWHEIDRGNPPEFISEIVLWDVLSEQAIQVLHPTVTPYWEEVYGADVSEDGRRLAMVSPHRLFMWEIGESRPAHAIRWSIPRASSVFGMLRDASYCLVDSGDCHQDFAVRSYNFETGYMGRRFGNFGDAVTRVICSHDAQTVLMLSNDNSARLFEVASGKLLRVNVMKDRPILAAFRPDDKSVAIVSSSGDVTLWDLTGEQEFYASNFGGDILAEGQEARDLFSPDYIRRHRWDSRDKEVEEPLKVVRSAGRIQFSEEGNMLHVSGQGRSVHWSVDDPSLALFTNSQSRPFDLYLPTDFVFSPDGLFVMDSRGAEIWKLRDLEYTSPPWMLEPSRVMIGINGGGSTFSDGMRQQPDGSWQGAGWSRFTTEFRLEAGLRSLGGRWAMTQDGSLFANSRPFGEGTVFVWDRRTRELLHSLPREEYCSLLTFSLDEKSLISVSKNDCVVWDLDSSEETLRCPMDPPMNYNLMSMHPEGRYLALKGLTEIKVLDLETGHIDTIVDDLVTSPHAMTYTEDGKTLLALFRIGDGENVLNAYDAESGEKLDVAVPLKGAGIRKSLVPLDDERVFCRFDPDKWCVVDWKEGRVLRSHRLQVAYSDSDEEKEKAPWQRRTDALLLNPYHFMEMKNGTAIIHDVRTDEVVARHEVAWPPPGVRVINNGKMLISTPRGWVGLWDRESRELLFERKLPPIPTDENHYLREIAKTVSGDGEWFAMESGLGTIEINSLRSNDEQVRFIECPESRVRSMVFSPDAARLVVGFADGWLRSYDAESCSLLAEQDCIPVRKEIVDEEMLGRTTPRNCVVQVECSPDGATLYTIVQLEPDWSEERSESLFYGRDRNVICIRDAETLTSLASLAGGDETVGSGCKFSSNGSLFMRCIFDEEGRPQLVLHDIDSGTILRTFDRNAGESRNRLLAFGLFPGTSRGDSFGFLGNDRFLWRGDAQGRVAIHNIETGVQVAVVQGFEDGQWITLAEDGRFDASLDGVINRLCFLQEGESEATSAESFREELYQPGLLNILLNE
jgi:WD40 repeat protein